MKNQKKLLLILVLLVVCFACKKDDVVPVVDAVAGFTASSTTVDIDEEITFTNTSEDATIFAWSFGDGEVSTDENPTHSYSDEGNYTVRLIASNLQTADTTEKTITVVDPTVYLPAYTSGLMSHCGDYNENGTNNMDIRLYTGVDDDLNDQVLWFEMFITLEETDFDIGTYTFTDSNAPLTFDAGTYGPRVAPAYDNANGHTVITAGTVEISKVGDNYTFTINVTDENNQSLAGSYTGPLEFADETK